MIKKTNNNSNIVPENFIISSIEDDDNGAIDDVQLLLAAAREGRTDEVVRILKKDPDLILIGDLAEGTALHAATIAGHEETLRRLLGITRQYPRLESLLLEGNADGDTALNLAVKNGHLKAAECLCTAQQMYRKKQDNIAYVVNKKGVSPWDLAQETGDMEMLRLILEPSLVLTAHSSIDMEMKLVERELDDEEEHEPPEADVNLFSLINSSKKVYKDAVKWFLGDLVRQVDSSEGNAIHVAARTGQEGKLRLLIKFLMASFEQDDLTCSLMLEKDIMGDTPLHTALKSGSESTAAAHYLTQVAPQAVYQVNEMGISPLYLAIEQGREELLRHMIRQASASHSLKKSVLSHVKKASLAHAAIKTNNLGILRALLEELPCLIKYSDAKGWKPLSYAAYKGYFDQVCYLSKTFPDSLNECDRDGTFPIHKAVAGGHISVVKEFLTNCPQALYAVDKKGRSSLHIAVRYGRRDILSYLIKEKGVEKIFPLKNNEGKTFMDLQESSNMHPYFEPSSSVR